MPVFEIFSIFRPYFRDSYYILFIFLFYDYRVLSGITGYYPTRLPAALKILRARPGGAGQP
jgi:hypothetical protein